MNSKFQELKELFESEEFQESAKKYAEKLVNEKNILSSQLERLHSKFSDKGTFSNLVEKIQIKYKSKKYAERWYKRGIEPPCDLSYFLFEYASKYGRECTEEEIQKIGNDFTSRMCYINGYYFNLMMGQGSAMLITKEN
jgi:replicative superfamily II helicase